MVIEYDFDNDDRLEEVRYPVQYGEPAKTITYQYDGAHNRKHELINQDDKSYSRIYGYNDLDQLEQITVTGLEPNDPENKQIEYRYDNNGNLNEKLITQTINNIATTTTNAYSFDIRGQLRSVTMGGSSVGQFLYDSAGQRLRTQYNQIENGQLAAQTEAQHSLYNGLKLLSQYDIAANSTTNLSLNANFQQAGSINLSRTAFAEDNSNNNALTFYHTDNLGSVLATSKTDKTIAARYDYDAWGNEINNTGTSNNPLGYTGHQMDRASENKLGLIYANARYLDPDTGRFLSFDPFEGYDDKPISLNKYLYAYQNPVVYIDPDGQKSMFGDAALTLGEFKDYLTRQNEKSDSQLAAVAIGTAQFVTSLGQGLNEGLDVAANIAQEAAGVDDRQVREELSATRSAIAKGINFAVNGDYTQAAKNVHSAAVSEAAKAMAGDVTATANLTQVAIGAALLKGGVKGKAKAIKENPTGVNTTTGASSAKVAKLRAQIKSAQTRARIRKNVADSKAARNGGYKASGVGSTKMSSAGNVLIKQNKNGSTRYRRLNDGSSDANKKTHGNSHSARGPHDVYVVRNRKTGEVLRFGETGRGAKTRLSEHARKLKKEHGYNDRTYVEVLRTVEGKGAAKVLENRYIKTYEKLYKQRPPFNFNDH